MSLSHATKTADCRKIRRVCLFGTSANPPTGKGGHAGIVSFLASHSNNYDEVRVIPVYRHMFSSKRRQLIDFNHRLALCKLAFDGIPNVTVSDLEKVCFDNVAAKKGIITDEQKGQLRVAMIDLLEMLHDIQAESEIRSSSISGASDSGDGCGDFSSFREEYTLALGADTFMDLTAGKWKRSDAILRLLHGRILVIQRLTSSIEPNDRIKAEHSYDLVANDVLQSRVGVIKEKYGLDVSKNIYIVRIPELGAVSSSLVRDCQDESYLSDALAPKVLEYMKVHKLYSFSET